MNKTISWSKVVLVAIVAVYMFYYITSLSDWHFVDNVNLIFHEAGHVVFGFFGEFIKILGGTLMQIIIPSVFSLYFYRKEDYFSASLLLFWLSQNFFNISVYAGDAIKMELPLLGGDSVYHDWNYILSSLNILRFTDQVASFMYIIGWIILIFAIIYSLKFSFRPNDAI
ncbi:MAG: hypothetical protein UR85_C0001G0022 [Candidatus Nomurabacteria bacterium GW2011_GWF2_35_66]|uniref:Uncharacterized protein n=1 Tax=Candidatus Nomurabacteria bacterium GW2011_GWE1_35_16 TaxID=1618761 RepID=A0A0G0EHI4_9BACT|nr:MAG: hypothetical protein UR55_C0003G0027 [Candidatus Nomurabacteria bacterium GW2011_GWF1_34_20]KKP63535.1 MAG: hypothetical protein UR57_C0003G0022 [Candidatus Nomurabacteria bacterium GW2011_GWE2_34_25]KKP66727.1 MAG: hypothetical protein UR64_C0003G0020 [Candidatus Nomurabacteria bacterium GW2011_GWE1_35_16]KKP83827.1 MAG: hypothetical protein UR85_C0001G0022 [Candidatus Nomurabacteria bacterium GW2011_GWF2_35_66]HAE36383.1 hypothetical protein [Candidatus Nomurabacteria bacterium]